MYYNVWKINFDYVLYITKIIKKKNYNTGYPYISNHVFNIYIYICQEITNISTIKQRNKKIGTHPTPLISINKLK